MRVAKTYVILFFILVNCKTVNYIDENNLETKDYSLISFDDYNEFVYNSSIKIQADGELYELTKFKINLPKNIIIYRSNIRKYYFKFSDKQIVLIESNINKKVLLDSEWKLMEISDSQIYNSLNEFWKLDKLNLEYLKKHHYKRVNKLYTNGRDKILLYNIKEDNLEIFLKSIETFDYIDNVSN